DAAKDAQGLLELKIAKLGAVVGNARVMDEKNIDTSKVSVLSKVKIKNKKNDASMTYTLVSEEEADLKSGKISVKSPIGKGLLGKKVGDITQIQVPAGKVEFEIQDISI
ncbi:MAG: GreA/GreB family elongation factor, partial [Cyclobacteriaceae bacterium]|nr:GreA/GreB family elongation factor [Cyclobacteriaceae bacterium]